MKIEEIKAAIEADLKIDRFNLVDESARTPNLFSKYIQIYTDEKIRLRMLQRKYSESYIQRREFYAGNGGDKYKEEPFDRKVIRQDLDIWLDADSKIQDLKDRLTLQEVIIDILERTLKEINQRSYTIRNMTEMIKFESGQ